jgi:SAM-dependent methyltransferase
MALLTEEKRVGFVFNLDGDHDWSWLKKTLIAASFTPGNVEHFARMPPTERDHRLLAQNKCSVLLRLLRFGRTVKREDLQRIFAGDKFEAMVRSGLISSDGDGFKAIGSLSWAGDQLIVGDPAEGFHQVMSVSGSSRTLAKMTPRKRVNSVLDVGTGSGFQALLASHHADRVVATDISPRALEFASMNARLNGVSNIEFREGSFFAPVKGELFDLVVANPPYVVSPEFQIAFRDGGMGGDRVSEQMVRNVPEHLVEGGLAVVLVHWYHKRGQGWDERPASWGEGLGCDILLERFEKYDPISYAGMWFNGNSRDTNGPAKTFAEWLEFYQNLGADEFNFGVVVLRKRSDGENWLRFEDFAPLGGHIHFADVGNQIETIFAAEDLGEPLEDDLSLLNRRWNLHPAHLVQRENAFENGAWKTKVFRLVSAQGAPFSCALDDLAMELIGLLASHESLHDAIGCIANSRDVGHATICKRCLPVIRQLIRDGLITPGD